MIYHNVSFHSYSTSDALPPYTTKECSSLRALFNPASSCCIAEQDISFHTSSFCRPISFTPLKEQWSNLLGSLSSEFSAFSGCATFFSPFVSRHSSSLSLVFSVARFIAGFHCSIHQFQMSIPSKMSSNFGLCALSSIIHPPTHAYAVPIQCFSYDCDSYSHNM